MAAEPTADADAPEATQAAQQEIWREPVRGGYPEPWMLALPGRDRLAR